MLYVIVKYFLNTTGKTEFQQWFDKVVLLTSQQSGFISISHELDEDANYLVHLRFENRDKLNVWANTEQHNNLAMEIESYFIKPKEVEFIEIN